MAERMVKEFGMSERIGLVAHREERSQQFLGMGAVDRPYGDETAKLIDEEVKGIIGAEYIRAKELLGEHREALEEIVEILYVVCYFGFLNRWNDSCATELEGDPTRFAEAKLGGSGWQAGKHAVSPDK